MDEKIIGELDNLNVEQAGKLIDSLDTEKLNEEIDKETAERIKASVLKKAGIASKKVKKPLIPNKVRFLTGALVMSLVELFFFTSSAFVAWLDGLLGGSGINLSIGGIITFILYFALFGCMSLSVYMAMYHMDSDRLTIGMLLPKSRTSLVYLLFFVLSAVVKVFIIISFIFAVETFDRVIYVPEIPELFSGVVALMMLLLIIAATDMLLSKLKNLIILKLEGVYSNSFKWKLGIKSFLIELLKNAVIIGFIIAAALLGLIGENRTVEFVIGFTLLVAANSFMTAVVLMKKRHCLQVNTSDDERADDKADGKKEDKFTLNWLFLKRRAFACGLLSAALIYSFCFLATYAVRSGTEIKRPLLETFADRGEAMSFFKDRRLPFIARASEFNRVSEFSEAVFVFNKIIIGAVNLKPNFIFAGVAGSKNYATMSDAAQTNGAQFTEAVFNGYSTTNTQVKDVDEADVIKTDGRYVYYLNKTNLFIVEAAPPEQMRVIHKYDFSQEGLYPVELFLYKEHMAVVLTEGQENYRYNRKTIVKTYNIYDPSNPTLERSLKLDYPYLTSRMIDNNLYLVATAYLNFNSESPSYPGYTDSAISNFPQEINYSDLYLMRGNSSHNYRQINVVAAFPVDEPYSKAQVKAYIGGGGETVYVSTEHIYIVESTRDAITGANVKDFLDVLTGEDLDMLDYRKDGTNIYRIGIQDGNIGGFASAFVPGRVHNQFSMDEYNGYFRLTTQTGRWQYASSNVYVLDSEMNICGSLEGLAPEESIYAARFMGDRLYLVTFKQVDPLFVISLEDPNKPVVLGKLKIPGYSEYIHPLDENHIIGFGKDTAGGDETFAWYQGIKMAIFDVSDVNNPKEKFVEIIGDRGTDSELLRNHKALMFMKELGLMAFPVTLVDSQEGLRDDGYRGITYQGAYVYNVSSSDGFKLRGRITHLDSSDYSYIYENANSLFINRIIYANESLYTFSGGKVKATRYKDMEDISQISLD